MKVRCSMCLKYVNGVCKAKGIRTKASKPRVCSKYEKSLMKEAILEYKQERAEKTIPRYRPTYRYYDGSEGEKFVRVNPPKKTP